jgi:hypothetical protein
MWSMRMLALSTSRIGANSTADVVSFATFRRYLLLVLLILFVGYFGVWQLYSVMLPAFGLIWASVLGMLAASGLGVIAIVGMVMVQTKEVMDATPPDELGS